MLGVLSFDSVRTERDWPDELVERLRLLSEAFAGALERKCMESALAERLRFQRLLSDLSARFANVPALDFDQAVRGAFPGHGRAGNSWSLQGTTDMASIPWLLAKIQDGNVVRGSRLEALPDIKSLVAVPLRAAGAVLGGLVVATVVAERVWSDELLDQLHLVGETVANALAPAQAEREATRLRQQLAHIGRVSAMGELTASLAHELNQPLTAILNNAEVALRHLDAASVDPAALREILSDIVADDKRAAAVIHRLRALVMKGDLAHVSLDINDVVAEVAQLVRSDVLIRKIRMTVDLAPGLPGIRGDRIQLQQVVLNMVLNGLEAMVEPNGRERALAIRTARAGDVAVMVAVEDSGDGIDADDVERLFYSSRCTPRSPRGWAWASPLRAPSSTRMAAGCVRRTIRREARRSDSRCLPAASRRADGAYGVGVCRRRRPVNPQEPDACHRVGWVRRRGFCVGPRIPRGGAGHRTVLRGLGRADARGHRARSPANARTSCA
jgi:signal transduction histidine kinase